MKLVAISILPPRPLFFSAIAAIKGRVMLHARDISGSGGGGGKGFLRSNSVTKAMAICASDCNSYALLVDLHLSIRARER